MNTEFLQKLAAEIEKDESKSESKPKGDKPEAKGKSDKKPPFGKKDGESKESKPKSNDEQNNGGASKETIPPTEAKQAVVAENGESEIPGNEQTEGTIASGTGQTDPRVIIDFFAQTPMPTDQQYHEFAEQQGIDIHAAEQIAYALAGKYVMFLRGGKSQGFDPNSVDPKTIEQGMQVESEHTPDPASQKKICLDHISEMPDYYDRLVQMEGNTGEQKQAVVPKQGESDKNKENKEKGYKQTPEPGEKGQRTEGDGNPPFQS